jgi:hypothetical protein
MRSVTIYNPRRFHYDNLNEEGEMDGTCVPHRRERKYMQGYGTGS